MYQHIVVPEMPGLNGHSAITCGDYLVLYGGKTGSHSLNRECFALNFSTNEWRHLKAHGSEALLARAFHTAVMYDRRMLVFGGLIAVGVDDLHYNAFNLVANVDALPEKMLAEKGPERRINPSGLPPVTQEKLEKTHFYSLDLRGEPTWHAPRTSGAEPPTRAGHVAAIYGNQMLIYGGYSVHTTARSTDEEYKQCYSMYSLNLETLVWTQVDAFGASSPQRWGSSAILSGNIWMHFGGFNPAEAAEDNNVAGFSLTEREWRHLPLSTIAPPRRCMGAAIRWGSEMICFGGVGYVGSMLFNDVFALDLATGKWREVKTTGTAAPPRSGMAVAIVNEYLYVVGGLDSGLRRSNRIWSLNLKTFEWSAVNTTWNVSSLGDVTGLPQDRTYASDKPTSLLDPGTETSDHTETDNLDTNALVGGTPSPTPGVKEITDPRLRLEADLEARHQLLLQIGGAAGNQSSFDSARGSKDDDEFFKGLSMPAQETVKRIDATNAREQILAGKAPVRDADTRHALQTTTTGGGNTSPRPGTFGGAASLTGEGASLPNYEKIHFNKGAKGKFVSPSIAKLGLAGELGKHK